MAKKPFRPSKPADPTAMPRSKNAPRGKPGRPKPLHVKPMRDVGKPKQKPEGGNKPAQPYRQSFTARPTVRIDLDVIKQNYAALQDLIGDVKIGACVKADAYGLGLAPVSRSLYGAGCRTFFVATAGEGKMLREAIGENATIYVLNGPAPQDLTLYFAFRLKPVINSLAQARMWVNEADRAKHAPFTALHIDTGMNRLGMDMAEVDQLSKNTKLFKALGPDLVMSHLACAPDAAHPMNKTQLDLFRSASSRLPVLPLSMANSAGIYLGKPYHFQMVRPGISLYGGQASTNKKQEVTKSAVSLMAPVLQVRNIKEGDTIGYNATYTAQRDMKIAVLGAGYADGIPVSASSGAKKDGETASCATLMKKRVPIIGRVSMDTTIVDISAFGKEPNPGEWAEFRGDNLEADAHAIGTINYELLVRIGSRCRRTYLKAGSKF